jgi:CspA family cold shock protein
MNQGTIKSLRDRGFGFITPDGETQDLFFHMNSVEGTHFDQLREGQRVEFVAGTDPRNPGRSRAEHVRVAGSNQMSDQLAGWGQDSEGE